MTFEVYGKDDCRYCTMAVNLLSGKNLSYKEFKLGREFTREELFELFPGAKQFPQIRVKIDKMSGSYYQNIGGYDKLQAYLVANQN